MKVLLQPFNLYPCFSSNEKVEENPAIKLFKPNPTLSISQKSQVIYGKILKKKLN